MHLRILGLTLGALLLIGAAAYLQKNGRFYVAGISAWSSDAGKDGIASNYGDVEAYARVSSYRDWIRRQLARE